MSWCWLMLKSVFLFPVCGVKSSSSLIWVKKTWQGDGMNDMACSFFCIYLFIIIYYGSSADTLSWDQIQRWTQPTAHSVAHHLHVPKGLASGRVSSFGDSSLNAVFAHLTPSGTAITQAHSRKGTEYGRKSGEFKASKLSGSFNAYSTVSYLTAWALLCLEGPWSFFFFFELIFNQNPVLCCFTVLSPEQTLIGCCRVKSCR